MVSTSTSTSTFTISSHDQSMERESMNRSIVGYWCVLIESIALCLSGCLSLWLTVALHCRRVRQCNCKTLYLRLAWLNVRQLTQWDCRNCNDGQSLHDNASARKCCATVSQELLVVLLAAATAAATTAVVTTVQGQSNGMTLSLNNCIHTGLYLHWHPNQSSSPWLHVVYCSRPIKRNDTVIEQLHPYWIIPTLTSQPVLITLIACGLV